MKESENKAAAVHAVIADGILRTLLAEALETHLRIGLVCHDSLTAALAAPCVLFLDRTPDRNFSAAPAVLVEVLDALPVRMGEILDRVAAHLRTDTIRWQRGATKKIGPYSLNPDAPALLDGKGKIVARLTEKERDILLKLLERPGETVVRGALLQAVWGYAGGVETHTLETHIYRLRRKMEDDPAKPRLLVTDETGYRLTE